MGIRFPSIECLKPFSHDMESFANLLQFIPKFRKLGFGRNRSLTSFSYVESLSFLRFRFRDGFNALRKFRQKQPPIYRTDWITINEVNALSLGGYDDGILAPNRCSKPFGNCQKGNSVLEPYIIAHHLLLAHSSAASLYKKYYQANQKGIIGLNVLVFNFLPLTNSAEDLAAKSRAFDFYSGWFIEPLVRGDYPKSMRLAAGNKIPKFTVMQSNQLKKSFDFFGVNYYMTLSVKNKHYA